MKVFLFLILIALIETSGTVAAYGAFLAPSSVECNALFGAPVESGYEPSPIKSITDSSNGEEFQKLAIYHEKFQNGFVVYKLVAKTREGIETIGTADAFLKSPVVDIGLVRVASDFRRQGVQDVLLNFFVKDPSITKIKTTLTGTNVETLAESLIRYAKGQADFDILNSRLISKNSRTEGFSMMLASTRLVAGRVDPVSEMTSCCGNFLLNLQEDPPRFAEAINRAILDTPAYRSRRKLGFAFCEKPVADIRNREGVLVLTVSFVACRP